MEPLGIMLYGYGKDRATTIREALVAALGRDVTLISASGREGDTVEVTVPVLDYPRLMVVE